MNDDASKRVNHRAQQTGERIPVSRVIETLDRCFARNDLPEAGRLLTYWRREAVALEDVTGELSMVNEQLGYYRRTMEPAKGLEAVARALALVARLDMGDSVSAATIYLNAATTLKAFGQVSRALPLYEHADAVYRRRLDATDARLGGLYNNWALALVDAGRWKEAERLYQQALEVALSEDLFFRPLEAAITYVNMAYLYEAWQGEETSERCMRYARDLLLRNDIPRDGAYAFACEKCAPAFRHFAWSALATQLEQTARSIYEGA